jgi:hypothetical protein
VRSRPERHVPCQVNQTPIFRTASTRRPFQPGWAKPFEIDSLLPGPYLKGSLKLLRALDQPKAVMSADRRKAEKQQGPPERKLEGKGTRSSWHGQHGHGQHWLPRHRQRSRYLHFHSTGDHRTPFNRLNQAPPPSQPSKKGTSDPQSRAPAWRDRQGPTLRVPHNLDAAGRGRTAGASGSTNSDRL